MIILDIGEQAHYLLRQCNYKNHDPYVVWSDYWNVYYFYNSEYLNLCWINDASQN